MVDQFRWLSALARCRHNLHRTHLGSAVRQKGMPYAIARNLHAVVLVSYRRHPATNSARCKRAERWDPGPEKIQRLLPRLSQVGYRVAISMCGKSPEPSPMRCSISPATFLVWRRALCRSRGRGWLPRTRYVRCRLGSDAPRRVGRPVSRRRNLCATHLLSLIHI